MAAIWLTNVSSTITPSFKRTIRLHILAISSSWVTTKIVFPYAKSLLEVTDNEEIFQLADKVDDLLKSAFDNIK